MGFRKELEDLLNKHSKENGSNTPDFILARYLDDCLCAFDRATTARSEWYGYDKSSLEKPIETPLSIGKSDQ